MAGSDVDREKHRDSSKRSHRDDRERDREHRRSDRHHKSDSSKKGNDSESLSAATDEPAAKRMRPAEENQLLTTKTGGAYIPPARLRMMQANITDKSSLAYQRIAWEALKKSVHGLINKVNVANIRDVVQQLFRENIVRGRGLFARSCIEAQGQSPTFTHVYAALVAVINTKFPHIGELILKRLITSFRKAYRRNLKAQCLSTTTFIAHLVNQQVADEVIALEIVTLLLENPTDDSVEIAIGFLKECGLKLQEVSPKGLNAVFDSLRTILQEAQIDTRVQYMVEVLFAIRKDKFKDHPSVLPELDLVEEEDQFTHPLSLDGEYTSEDMLNVFQFDPDYLATEEKYKVLKRDILDEPEDGSEEDGDGQSGSEDEEDDGAGMEVVPTGDGTIVDATETNLVTLRKNIYLTIQSSLDFEEACHKLMKLNIKPGQESELCHMIVDCCAQQRTYEKFFGLLAQRFCQINQQYVEPFQKIFVDSYDTIHRLETNKLRNVGNFMAHLFFTDAISWLVLGHIKLNEEDTSSSSRIFIKIMFQVIAEYMGMAQLIERIRDPALQEAFEGLFPRDNPKNTRFSINFFTSIGLGGLTDDLREHLQKAVTKAEEPVPLAIKEESSDSSSSSSSDSSSEESDSDDDDKRKKKSDHRTRRQDRRNSHDRSESPRRARPQREESPRRTRRQESPKRERLERSPRRERRDEPARSDRRRGSPPQRRGRHSESPPPRRDRHESPPREDRRDQSSPRRETRPQRTRRSPSDERTNRQGSPDRRDKNRPRDGKREKSR